jgi:hypothetical protein
MNGGDTFASPTLVPGSMAPDGGHNGSQHGLLMRKLAVNAGGQMAVVNSSFRQGERSLVCSCRRSWRMADGKASRCRRLANLAGNWAATHFVLSSAPLRQFEGFVLLKCKAAS